MVSEKEVASMVALVATGTRNTSSPTTSGAVNGEGEGEGEGDTPEGRGEGLAVREARGVPVPVSVAVAEPEAHAVTEVVSVAFAEREARTVPESSDAVAEPVAHTETENSDAVAEPVAHTETEEDRVAHAVLEAHTVAEEVGVAHAVPETESAAEPDEEGEVAAVADHVHMQEQKAVCEGLMEDSAEGEPLVETAEGEAASVALELGDAFELPEDRSVVLRVGVATAEVVALPEPKEPEGWEVAEAAGVALSLE